MTAAAYPRLEFDLPGDHWALSLDGDPAVRAGEHRELVDRLLPLAPPERTAAAVRWFADVAAGYDAAGVAYAANLAGGAGDRPAIGHFTITLHPFGEADPRAAAYAIAEMLRTEPGRTRAVKLVSLPCGPAVATEELRAIGGRWLGQSQVFVKPRRSPGLVVLTMVTPATGDLGDCMAELAAIAESLRIVEDG